MKKHIRTVKKAFPEARAGQIDREIDTLVFGFHGKPSKKVVDSLYYLTRERARLLRTKSRRSDQEHDFPEKVAATG